MTLKKNLKMFKFSIFQNLWGWSGYGKTKLFKDAIINISIAYLIAYFKNILIFKASTFLLELKIYIDLSRGISQFTYPLGDEGRGVKPFSRRFM